MGKNGEQVKEMIRNYMQPAVADGLAMALKGVEDFGGVQEYLDSQRIQDDLREMTEKNTEELAEFIEPKLKPKAIQMKDIQIIPDVPAIFTKDKEWVKQNHIVQNGSIVLLPEDAVLVMPPIIKEVRNGDK